MSDIGFKCPACGELLVVDARGSGLTVNCAECSSAIRVPDLGPARHPGDLKMACPQCTQHFEVPPEMFGQTTACPTCQTPVTIPDPNEPDSLPPAPAGPVSAPDPLPVVDLASPLAPEVRLENNARKAAAAAPGIIDPGEHHLVCGTCNHPIDRDLAKPDTLLGAERKTVCPHYCSSCDTWFHPSCLPKSSIRDNELLCPKCAEQAKLTSPTFYCPSCAKVASVNCGTAWPVFTCATCGKPASLAVITDALGAELAWLIGAGCVSLVAFITALVQGFPPAGLYATGAVACVFALPLCLIVIAAILSALLAIFTPGGGSAIPLFAWKGGVDGLTLAQYREFKAKPPALRFAKVYLWLAVNSLVGAAVTLIAFAGLYVLMQFAQQKHS